MDRITSLEKSNNKYVIAKGSINEDEKEYYDKAIDKLGRFEDMIDKIIKRQEEIEKELQRFPVNERLKTYKNKELMAEKLTNSKIISTLKIYDII